MLTLSVFKNVTKRHVSKHPLNTLSFKASPYKHRYLSIPTQTPLLPGKTTQSSFFNKIPHLLKTNKGKLAVALPICGLIYAIGPKVVLVFAMQSLAWLAVGGIGFYFWFQRTRIRQMVLYPQIIKEINKNRKKIEKVIGGFETPSKHDIQVELKQSPGPGRKRDCVLYHVQFSGTRGQAQCLINTVKLMKPTSKGPVPEWVIENFQAELHGIDDGAENVLLTLVSNTIPPIPTVLGEILEEETI